MPRNKSEKGPVTRRVLHPNAGWMTMSLRRAGGEWVTDVGGMAPRHFGDDYAQARKYFDEHPREFWWDGNTTVGLNDHPQSESLNAGRDFPSDHPDLDAPQ